MTTSRAIRPPIFRRHEKYIAVKPIRLASTVTVAVGESVDDLREYHKRSLWQRRLIGPVGHPWTAAMIEGYEGGDKRVNPATRVNKPAPEVVEPKTAEDLLAQESARKWTVKGSDDTFSSKKKALEAAQAIIDEAAVPDVPILFLSENEAFAEPIQVKDEEWTLKEVTAVAFEVAESVETVEAWNELDVETRDTLVALTIDSLNADISPADETEDGDKDAF